MQSQSRLFLVAASAVVLTLITSAPLHADTYTLSADGSGSLNGVSFTNAAITFTTATSNHSYTVNSQVEQVYAPPIDFTIAGIGSGTLTTGESFIYTDDAGTSPGGLDNSTVEFGYEYPGDAILGLFGHTVFSLDPSGSSSSTITGWVVSSGGRSEEHT